MNAMSKELLLETARKRLEELVKLYMHQTPEQAYYWAGLLLSMQPFSFYYYRTHLLLGNRNLYLTVAREQDPQLTNPAPCDWYIEEGRQTGRMEDVLDRCVHLVDGRVTAPIIGIDTKLNRALAEDGQVYELRDRVEPVKQPAKAALLYRK